MHPPARQVGDFNYRVDAPPGFEVADEGPENTRNDQLYAFVHDKVRRAAAPPPAGLQLPCQLAAAAANAKALQLQRVSQ